MITKKEDCAVYIVTIKSGVIKSLFESLKDLLDDINMVFTPDGVHICDIDTNQTLIVDVLLDKDKLQDYYCPQNIEIGISIPNFHKILKTMSNNGTNLTLYMTKDDLSVLRIKMANDDSVRKSETVLNLMDLENDNEISFPDDDFSLILSMDSSEFKDTCNSIRAVEAKKIQITYSKGVYTFYGKGKIGEQTITHIADRINDDEDNQIYKGIFDLDRLCLLTKCSNLSTKVKLMFKNDRPMVCGFDLAVGDLYLMLCQIDDDLE